MGTLREKFTCPKCGSTWVLRKMKGWVDTPVTGLLTRPLLSLGKSKKLTLKCAGCKHEWKPFLEED